MAQKLFRILVNKLISACLTICWDWWHTRILLINYTGNEFNYGCIATSKCLVRLIRDKYPNCAIRIQPISYKSLRIFIPFNDNEIDNVLPAYMLKEKRKFRFFKWADIIILNGEGSIHEYKESKLNQLCFGKLLQVYAAKKIYNKKVYAVNQTLDYKNEYFGRIIRKCYEPLDYIAVRELNSFHKAQEIGLTKTKLSSDAAFLLKGGSNQNVKRLLHSKGLKNGFVCIFLSETILESSPSKTIGLVEMIRKRLDRDILIGAVTDTDIIHIKEIKKHIHVPTIGAEVHPEDLVEMLKYADITLSGRFHCCIFSFLANTPLLPFHSNTHKVEGLIRLMKYPVDVYDYAKDSNDSIINGIEKVLYSTNELKDKIRTVIPEVRALAQLNIM